MTQTGTGTDAAHEVPHDRRAARWQVPTWLQLLGGWSWRILVFGVVAWFGLRFLVALRVVVLPIIIAVLAAALLSPLHRWMTDRGVPRLLSAWLVMLAGIGVVAGLLASASYFIGTELAQTAQWSETADELREWLRDGPAGLDEQSVQDFEDRARDWLTSGFGGAPADRARLLGEMLGATVLALILTFFFVKDGAVMWRWLTERVDADRRPSVDRAGREAFTTLRGYVRGVAVTGVVDAVLIGALLLVLGVPLAVPLAVLTFFGAFFPIVGATVVGAAGALVALVANGPRTAIIVAAGTLVIQQVEGDVVMPAVMKKTVNLHPVVVLVALASGGAIGGIAGAFVAVPLAATIAAASRALA